MSDLLMKKKLDYLIDIKKITAFYNFKGDEKETEDYISMIDKREYVLSKIQEIDLKLSQNAKIEKNSEIQARINEVIQEIAELDKINKVNAEKIKQDLALKIGEVKTSRKVSNAYHGEAAYLGVSEFDSKR